MKKRRRELNKAHTIIVTITKHTCICITTATVTEDRENIDCS